MYWAWRKDWMIITWTPLTVSLWVLLGDNQDFSLKKYISLEKVVSMGVGICSGGVGIAVIVVVIGYKVEWVSLGVVKVHPASRNRSHCSCCRIDITKRQLICRVECGLCWGMTPNELSIFIIFLLGRVQVVCMHHCPKWRSSSRLKGSIKLCLI